MTYRKLFLYLLFGSTLALGVVWWMSFRSWYTVAMANPPFTASAHLRAATISVAWKPDESVAFPVYFRSIPVRRPPTNLSTLMGKFNVRTHNIYHVAFPVWLPYLLFVGGSFVALRFMERLPTAGGRERDLASQAANAASQDKPESHPTD